MPKLPKPEQMTDQEINIAIAELCGWKLKRGKLNGDEYHWLTTSPDGKFIGNLSYFGLMNIGVPNYVADLNAIHEAEMKLKPSQQLYYAQKLHDLFKGQKHYLHKDYDVLHTTARQRAVALLQIVGKWKDK